MARNTERSRPQKKSGAGAAVAGLGVVVMLGAIVILGIMASKNSKKGTGKVDVVEKRDPFEGLDRDEQMIRKAPAPTGFSGKSFESEALEWAAAREIQGRAATIHAESAKLREAGDSDWRKVGHEAKDLYEQAMEKGRAYRKVYAGEFGEASAETKRLDQTLDIWNRALVGLHKTVGA